MFWGRFSDGTVAELSGGVECRGRVGRNRRSRRASAETAVVFRCGSLCVVVEGVEKRQECALFFSEGALLPEEFLKDGAAIFLHDSAENRALMIEAQIGGDIKE
ncbi:MAG: hypothetical protein RL215_1607 [Planctomycetota bacterium]